MVAKPVVYLALVCYLSQLYFKMTTPFRTWFFLFPQKRFPVNVNLSLACMTVFVVALKQFRNVETLLDHEEKDFIFNLPSFLVDICDSFPPLIKN